MKDLVLFYHANCPDGFGSAYAFWCKFGDSMDYIALEHKERDKLDLETLRGKTVYMADISLRRERTLELKKIAKKYIVLDHHKSAEADIGDLDFCVFDMERSGAVMSWEHLFDKPVPRLLEYIQDRDIWNWRLENTDSALLFADSIERTFKAWDWLCREFEGDETFKAAIGKGEAIKGYRDMLISRLMDRAFKTNIKGYDVLAINLPFFQTEVVTALAETGVPFAVGYSFDGEIYKFSMRSSRKEFGVDVSEIASKFFGGGGHKHASGFSVKDLKELK